MKTLLLTLLSLAVFFQSAEAFCEEEISDPIEPVNRGIFWFNDKLDVYVLEPVAQGYSDTVPDGIQRGVHNFFLNLRYPRYLVSDVVQLKFTQAAEHTGRFLLNSTLGIAGLFDVAAEVGLEDHNEDFGIALAYHGVPAGPYLVLPLLGPSNLRDTVGTVVDTFLDPLSLLYYSSLDDAVVLPIDLGLRTIRVIDQRAGLLDAVEAAKESSVDYYLFIQSAYYQHREGVLYDGNPPEEEIEAAVATHE